MKSHVRRASLEQDEFAVQALWELLSPDERQRADRFDFERDRRRFIVRRSMLRDVHNRNLGRSPTSLPQDLTKLGR
jgi:4'-phosphopantetheinyl transferase